MLPLISLQPQSKARKSRSKSKSKIDLLRKRLEDKIQLFDEPAPEDLVEKVGRCLCLVCYLLRSGHLAGPAAAPLAEHREPLGRRLPVSTRHRVSKSRSCAGTHRCPLMPVTWPSCPEPPAPPPDWPPGLTPPPTVHSLSSRNLRHAVLRR